MPIAFGSLMLLYIILAFAMSILTSQMMVILQGHEAGVRLEAQSKPRVRWYGILSMMGYNPLNPYLWFEVVRASDLPAGALKKQGEMRIVFIGLIVTMAIFGGLLLFGG